MSRHLPNALPGLIVLLFAACSPRAIPPVPVLLNAVQLVYYTNATLQQVSTSHDSLVFRAADYTVSVNRISYRTTLDDGTSVTASGVVYIPTQAGSANKRYPLLSYQHPTAFSNADAPSGYNYGGVSFSYQLYFATHGYIVACPDYVGYGDADKLPHDYEHGQSLARATVDMLLATKEFLAKQNTPWNEQVFLTGYSEGGYASLSAQKLLEERYDGILHMAGSSCGAGPYAMPTFFGYVTQHPTVGGVANQLYAWQVMSYNRIYGLNKPVSYYFKSPYAELIAGSLANARSIPLSFDKICTDQFLADVRNPASPFAKALADNDLTDWSTRTATRFIHGQQDEIVPYLTSQQTYAAMQRRGSPNLNLVTIKSGGHIYNEVIFIRRSLEWFEQLRK